MFALRSFLATLLLIPGTSSFAEDIAVSVARDGDRLIQSVLVAEYICILAYGAEFFVKTLNYRKVGKKQRMATHTQRLVDKEIIDAELKVELDWMWDVRTHEHLDATTDLRHCTHDRIDFNRAIVAWNAFMKRMQAAQFDFVNED